MDEKNFWMLSFIAIASIRHHPRNMDEATPYNSESELQRSYDIANRMTDLTIDRWGPWQSQPQSSPEEPASPAPQCKHTHKEAQTRPTSNYNGTNKPGK